MSRTALLSACAIAAAACSDSTAPTPDVTVDAWLSEVSHATTLGAPAATFGGMTSVAEAPHTGPCPYNVSTQRFVCVPVTANGYTFNRYYQLLDASNSPLSTFDVTKVVAIRSVTDVTGSTASQNNTISTTAHDDATLTGLRGDTHTLNSTGTTTSTSTSGGQTVTLNMSQTVKDLVLPRQGSANPYPRSGTIAMTLTSSSGGSNATTTFTLTFNGTSTVTWTSVSGATTQTCTFDMANTQAQPACH